MNAAEHPLKTILKGSIIVFIGVFLSKLLGYVYRLIVARIGVEQYGLFSLGLSVVGIFVTISLLGLPEGIKWFVAFYQAKNDKARLTGAILFVLKLTSLLSVAFGILIFFLSDWISLTFFHEAKLSLFLKILAIAIPLDVIGTMFFSILIGFKKIQYQVYVQNIIENVAKVVLTAFLVYLGFEAIGATIAYVIALAIGLVLGFYYLNKKVFSFLKTELKPLYSSKAIIEYSLPLIFSNFALMTTLWIDTLMLGYFRTASEVGIYNAAQPTAKLLYLFPYAITVLFLPVLTEIRTKKDSKSFKSIYNAVTKWIFMINSVLLVLFVTFSKDIMRIIFTPEYVSGWPVLVILSLGYFVMYFLSPAGEILLILKKTKLALCNNLFMVVINVALNYYLIPIYGFVGAAIATSISFALKSIAVYIEIFLITKLNPFKRSYLKILLSLTVSFFIIHFILSFINKNFYTLALICTLFSLIYLFMLILTKSFEEEDKMVIAFIQQKLNPKKS